MNCMCNKVKYQLQINRISIGMLHQLLRVVAMPSFLEGSIDCTWVAPSRMLSYPTARAVSQSFTLLSVMVCGKKVKAMQTAMSTSFNRSLKIVQRVQSMVQKPNSPRGTGKPAKKSNRLAHTVIHSATLSNLIGKSC